MNVQTSKRMHISAFCAVKPNQAKHENYYTKPLSASQSNLVIYRTYRVVRGKVCTLKTHTEKQPVDGHFDEHLFCQLLCCAILPQAYYSDERQRNQGAISS